MKRVAAAGAVAGVSGPAAFQRAFADVEKSLIFSVNHCPSHDGRLRHRGLDALLDLLADNGLKFYRASAPHPWGGPDGVIAHDDVVLIKVNCQWKCRGTTNTDVLRGLIHRILRHPDGFTGEVAIFENGQGRGAFDGSSPSPDSYTEPAVQGVHVNAEEETLLSVDYLVNTVFAGQPVSSFLLDTHRSTFLPGSEHSLPGYRKFTPPDGALVSYPCFTTGGGNRIELREGRWTGSAYADNVKLINLPVLKDHGGSGMTGVLKHFYGVVSMQDSTSANRHYTDIGTQIGKMWQHVRMPDLNILDCIWVSHNALRGYPPSNTRRCDILLSGADPVAMDYYASKRILLPLGGSQAARHDPDTFDGLKNMLLAGAQTYINANGGIHGEPTRVGDANIEVISRDASIAASRSPWRLYS